MRNRNAQLYINSLVVIVLHIFVSVTQTRGLQKIGTLHQYGHSWYFMLMLESRLDTTFHREFLAALEEIALPPKGKNVYKSESQYLGVVGFSVEMEPASGYLIGTVYKEFERHIRIYFKTILDEPGWKFRPGPDHPSWLEESPDNQHQTQRRNIRSRQNGAIPDESGDSKYLIPRAKSAVEHPEWPEDNGPEPEVEAIKSPEDNFDLYVLSQPPGVVVEELRKELWNYKNAGAGQVVYIIDTGFDLSHPELRQTKFGDWIDVGPFPLGETMDRDETNSFHAETFLSYEYVNHGTGIMSKIVGRETGVAQNAEVVVVPTSDWKGEGGAHTPIIDALIKVYDHIRTNNHDKNCIVNLSISTPLDELDYWAYIDDSGAWSAELLKENIKYLYEDLVVTTLSLGNVVFVVAAGNQDPDVPINSLPAVLAEERLLQDRLVVVGGYDPYTGRNSRQQSEFVKIWAPAESVNCACPWYMAGPNEYQLERQLCLLSGTSLAAPLVSGVILSLLSAGMSIDDVVPYIYEQAHPRVAHGPKVLYNGIPIEKWPEESWPDWYRKGKPTPPPPRSVFSDKVKSLKM
ncbi:hypothetical protein TWF281_002970 [Arthrobotrys megalospora]